MQINIDEINICVINLKERPERLLRTQLQLNEFFVANSKQFHLIEAIRDKPPFKGIAQSHMNAIQLAKDNDWEYVIIVEDDVNFQSKFSKHHADKCFSNIPEDFEVLCSGVYTASNLKKYNLYWNSVEEFSALHFYLVRNTAYDRILAFNKDQHIDRWLGKPKDKRFAGCGLKCYVADEFFAIQFPGFSDNVNKEMNYDHLLKKFKILK